MVIHWTHNDQMLTFVRHLKKITCVCNPCWCILRIWTLATSKMEHFVRKKIANAFPKIHLRNLLRKKMNITTDKYLQINTIKILHESFFFQNKTCYVNHPLFFIHSSFFQTFIDGYWLCRLHTQSVVLTS